LRIYLQLKKFEITFCTQPWDNKNPDKRQYLSPE